MKQLYNITRNVYYKKLLKNKKGWKIKRVQYVIEEIAYCYGFDAVKDDETIIVEPHASLLNSTSFTVTFKNDKKPEKNWVKEKLTFYEMQLIVNQIIYARNPKQIRRTP